MFEDPKKEDKAGYNRAGGISELLGNLTITFNGSMMRNDFSASLESCRSILNVISGKVKEKEIEEVNEFVYEIEDLLTLTEVTFVYNGKIFYKNPKERIAAKRKLESLNRGLEKLQNKYGYGMLSAEDPKMAIYK